MRAVWRMVRSWGCAVVLLATWEAAGGADWPQYRADAARSGYTAESLAPDLGLQWSYKLLHRPMPAWPDPGWERNRLTFDFASHVVVAGGRVFFGSSADCAVRALDAQTGQLQWRFLTGGPVRFAPAVWRDRVLVASDDGCLHCLAAASGELLWELYGGPRRQSILGGGRFVSRWPARGGPVVADDVVYFSAGIFPTQGAFLHALDPNDGEVIWVNDTACLSYVNIHMPSGSSFTGVAPQGYLVAQGDKLLAPTGRGLPGVFDRATGELEYYGNSPAFRAGGSWVMGLDEWFVCADKAYDLATGMMRCADLGNLDRSFGTPDKHARQLYVPPGHMARELAVTPDWLLVATGSEVKLAKRSQAFRGGPGPNPPTDNYLAPDLLAQLRGITFVGAVGAPSEGGLIAAAGAAYVGGKGAVSAIDLNRQRVVWTAEVEGTAYGLAVAGGRLFVCTSEGRLYCFAAHSKNGPRTIVEQSDRDPYSSDDRSAGQAAEEIIETSKVTEGYCFDLGCGDGRLAYELARRTDLTIYAVDSDGKNVQMAREALFRAGLYGTRVMVDHVASLEATPAPDYFAEMVVSGRSLSEGPAIAPRAEAMRAARPYGGIVLLGRRGTMEKAVRGRLEGAGRWSHQYADAANSLCSGDAVARSPLGVLWFGSPGQRGLPHGWGRPPAPLVVDGRMFIMGNDFIRCVDVYNGRVRWETPLAEVGKPYSYPHYAGTYLVGSHWCASSDSVYVHNGRQCYRLAAAGGKILRTYEVPDEAGEGEGRWGYVACTDDTLFGTCEGQPFQPEGVLAFQQQMRSQARALFALAPETGRLKWVYRAKHHIWRDTIAVASGKVFFIDRPLNAVTSAGELVALDAVTGQVAWKTDRDVFGNCLSVSEKHDVVLMAFPAPPGSPIRALEGDVDGDRMAAFRASTGEKLWDKPQVHGMRPAIVGRTIFTQSVDGETLRRKRTLPADAVRIPPGVDADSLGDAPAYLYLPDAFDLLTGEPRTMEHPITGKTVPWTFGNLQRCGLASYSNHLMLYRTSDLTYYDLSRDQGTSNFGGYRPGCWINVIPAGGLVLAPDSWSSCFCSHTHRTTVALMPVDANEHWGIVHASRPRPGRIGPLRINLGAPGDRRDDHGALWLAFPRPYQRRPHWFPKALDPGETVRVEGGVGYRRHSDLIGVGGTSVPWVLASGISGQATVSVDVSRMSGESRYAVRLHFAELERRDPGARVFDVKVAGEKMLDDFDVAAEAGGPLITVVRECVVQAADKLTVELLAEEGEPMLSGLEIRPLATASSASD